MVNWHGSGWLARCVAVLVASCITLVGVGCVNRNSSEITRTYTEVENRLGLEFQLDFYRNTAYECGVSGNYSFLVVNPANNPNANAPLWVYFHGGGVGYFDRGGTYRATIGQDENGWNREETFDALWDGQVLARTLSSNGRPIDQTLKRRIQQGYRVLVVSMCDHDLYSGTGSPYPDNRYRRDTVDGLVASMAAVDYVSANYPTTQVFAHGTSAGSIGAFSLAYAYASEGRFLAGVVADSYVISPRNIDIFDAFAGKPGFPFGAEFDVRAAINKVGPYGDSNAGIHPEALIRGGFDSVPVLFLGGRNDPFCGGNQPQLPQARAAGLDNCSWAFDGVRQAIDGQTGSPHRISILPNAGHVPTNVAGPANDAVDLFLLEVYGNNPPPFAAQP